MIPTAFGDGMSERFNMAGELGSNGRCSATLIDRGSFVSMPGSVPFTRKEYRVKVHFSDTRAL